MNKVISIYILLCLSSCYSKSPTLTTGQEGKAMPSIKLLLLDSNTFINTAVWKPGKPVAIVDISPYCPYCRAMTQNLIDENKKLLDIQFILLSTFPLSELRTYYNEYRLKDYSNIIIARDYENYFGQYFNSPGVPCTAIYGKDRLLKRVLMGKANINVIKDILSE